MGVYGKQHTTRVLEHNFEVKGNAWFVKGNTDWVRVDT